jgi:hypothetical protein
MKNESLPFLSCSLDRVQPGCVDIGAPLLNDVIQIHASDQDGKTRLQVSRGRYDVIEVYRQDEHLMEAEIVHIMQSDAGLLLCERKKIFKAPIARLFFMNIATKNNKNVWVATAPGLEIPDIESLQTFATVIGENSRNKQNWQALAAKRAMGSVSVTHTFN